MYCGNNTEVFDSRTKKRNPSVWRRRLCIACNAKFTTLEKPDYNTSLVVEGTRGKLYPFSRDKLLLSLYKSLGHRSDALNSASELTDTVIGKCLRQKKAIDGVIDIHTLASVSYLTLKRFDPAGANTYHAYHKTALKAQ